MAEFEENEKQNSDDERYRIIHLYIREIRLTIFIFNAIVVIFLVILLLNDFFTEYSFLEFYKKLLQTAVGLPTHDDVNGYKEKITSMMSISPHHYPIILELEIIY